MNDSQINGVREYFARRKLRGIPEVLEHILDTGDIERLERYLQSYGLKLEEFGK